MTNEILKMSRLLSSANAANKKKLPLPSKTLTDYLTYGKLWGEIVLKPSAKTTLDPK